MSRVLVTGGLGYIGSHTVVELAQSAQEIVIIDNIINSSQAIMPKLKSLVEIPLHYYECDIRDSARLRELMELHQIDTVIHLAALKAAGESVFKPLDYYAVNVNGTIELLKAMTASGVKKIIYSSSACVYGNWKGEYEETDHTEPINPYGQTKLMSEQVIKDTCVADPSFQAISLRYFNPVGAHPSGVIGEVSRDLPSNLVPYIQKVALGALQSLSVYGTDYSTIDGTALRDYIHIMDLAAGHVAAITALKAGYDVFNLGTGRGTSVLEMVEAYEQASSRPIPLVKVGRRAGDAECVLAKVEKANSCLNWRAKLSIQDMCRDSWNFVQLNPQGY
jgi:UDP-glucose 4-epimerase